MTVNLLSLHFVNQGTEGIEVTVDKFLFPLVQRRSRRMSAQVIFQKTLLRGETTIYGQRVVDSLCVKTKKEGSQKYSRTNLKLAHWCAVVQSGLALHRIGTYSDGSECPEKKNQPRVVLDFPRNDDMKAVAEYHNRCMMLCSVPYTCLLQKIQEKAGKQKTSAEASKGSAGEGPEKKRKEAPVEDAGASGSQPPASGPPRSQALGLNRC